MAFFNEFPHTRTYDSDLAWLIKRMKEVLARMDTLENKMKALEELVNNFIDTLNIDQLIKNYLQEMINNGDFDTIISTLLSSVASVKVCFTNIAPPNENYTRIKGAAFVVARDMMFLNVDYRPKYQGTFSTSIDLDLTTSTMKIYSADAEITTTKTITEVCTILQELSDFYYGVTGINAYNQPFTFTQTSARNALLKAGAILTLGTPNSGVQGGNDYYFSGNGIVKVDATSNFVSEFLARL